MHNLKNIINPLVGFFISSICLAIVLIATNPTSSGLLGMLLVLLLIYSLVLTFILLACNAVISLYRWIFPPAETTTRQQADKFFQRKLTAICAVLSTAPMLLISLNSIERIGVLDVLLVVVTEIVAIFYVSKKMK